MSETPPFESHTSNPIVAFWSRVPLVVRAILTGFLVFATVGVVAWMLMLTLIPAPWWVLFTALVLWVYLKWTSGSWWPASTSSTRRHWFRSTDLTNKVWMWSLFAAALAIVALQSSMVITFRIVAFSKEQWSLGFDFGDTPIWAAWVYVVVAAAVAGITEEVGFRGYMQVPLEDRYGPILGVAIVSVVFAVAHLNQAWAGPVLVQLFLLSAIWGTLAFASGSLIPGILSHAGADVVNFSYWWTDLAGTFTRRPISETGIDTHFVVWIVLTVVSVTLLAWTLKRTYTARHDR